MINDQIKPILHHSVTLMFQQDVYNFSRQRRNTVQVFNVKDLSHLPGLEKIKRQSQVDKLTKHLKFVRTLKVPASLDKPRSQSVRALCLAKNMSKVESLSWAKAVLLRNAKRITKVDFYPVQSENQESVETYETYQRIRKLLRFINLLKVKDLTIETDVPDENKLASLFQFSSSIQRLAISCAGYSLRSRGSEEAIIYQHTNSFQNLTNLKALHVILNDTSSVMISLLNSIPDLSKLEILELGVVSIRTDALLLLALFLSTLKKSNNLKRLILSFIYFPENINKFLEAVDGSSLIEFSYLGNLKMEQLNQLSLFSSSLTQVESLTLSGLDFYPRQPMLDHELSSADFMTTLNTLLKKPARLLKVDLSIIPANLFKPSKPAQFIEIIEMLTDTVPFLKMLAIRSRLLRLSDDQFSQMIKFFYTLKEIENLEFGALWIPQNHQFKRLVDWCCSSKYLKILKLGSIDDITPRAGFFKLVERVLLKKGLEIFSCGLNHTVKYTGDWPKLDLKLIKQLNPSLESFPSFTASLPSNYMNIRLDI